MRAAVYHGPHDLRVEERPPPDVAALAPGDVVLDVLRASICGSDTAEFDHGPVLAVIDGPHPHSGHDGPVVLGHEFVGRVAATGAGVLGFGIGDRVVTGAGVSCGVCSRCREGRTNLCESYFTLGFHTDGGLAEQVVAPASTLVRVPDGCDDDSAALAQPMAVGIHALNRSRLRAGDTLLVNGVGGIGGFAVAAAAARGVEQIIAVDVDEGRLASATRLGASRAVNASAGDVHGAVLEATGGRGADVAIEASGVPQGPGLCVASVRRGGTVVIVGLQKEPVAIDLFDMALREVDLHPSLAHVCATDVPEALEVLASGSVAAEVVDRVVPLTRLVPDGIEPLIAREVAGKVLVDPAG
jgi:threonine dehydrogenase-like Zn-dependent dehydrogenase